MKMHKNREFPCLPTHHQSFSTLSVHSNAIYGHLTGDVSQNASSVHLSLMVGPLSETMRASLEALWLISVVSETEIAPALFWIPKLNCMGFWIHTKVDTGRICGLELSWTLL